jgi:hypothetical protein
MTPNRMKFRYKGHLNIIMELKIKPKIYLKITKMKNIAAQDMRWFNPNRQLY